MPIIARFGWDTTWFDGMLTVDIALGRVTLPVGAQSVPGGQRCPAADGDHGRRGVAARDGHAAALVVTLCPGLSTWLHGLFETAERRHRARCPSSEHTNTRKL